MTLSRRAFLRGVAATAGAAVAPAVPEIAPAVEPFAVADAPPMTADEIAWLYQQYIHEYTGMWSTRIPFDAMWPTISKISVDTAYDTCADTNIDDVFAPSSTPETGDTEMAKPTTPKPTDIPSAADAPSVAEVQSVAGYTFEPMPLPPSGRQGGRAAEGGSKLALALAALPVNLSFLETVAVPETITDAGERDKAFKDEARKVTNRISGAIRRHRKANPLHNFTLRTVNEPKTAENPNALGVGVRVWRSEDSAEPELPPAPPAPPAPATA